MSDSLPENSRRRSRRLVLAGHSHIVALTGPQQTNVPMLRPVAENGDVAVLESDWPRTDAYWDALTECSFGADVALIWGGNEHNICYFFQADHAFDFLSKNVNRLIPSFQVVPKATIRRRFLDAGLTQLSRVMDRLSADGGDRRIAILGTPPPKRDNDALRAMLTEEPFFVEQAAFLGHTVETIPITAPHVRLKLWYLLQEMLADQARRVGAAFVPIPSGAQDEDGFLKPEYWTRDVTHANADYGRLMFEAMLAAFD